MKGEVSLLLRTTSRGLKSQEFNSSPGGTAEVVPFLVFASTM